MGYDYQSERHWVFSEAGQVQFLRIRDRINGWLKKTGALTIEAAISGESGGSWEMLACVDRLVELGEIQIIDRPGAMTQHNIIVRKAA